MIALYARVSHRDDADGASSSIQGQRLQLLQALCDLARREGAGGTATCEYGTLAGEARHFAAGCATGVPASVAVDPTDEVRLFRDDGYSGMNMDRPGLRGLLAAVAAGVVSMVIVRDFSRLARDYLDLGYLVEGVFPAAGVRLVAVGEGYDSAGVPTAAAAEDELRRGMVGIVNTAYSRDLSARVRSSMRADWHAGNHVQAFAPYGYAYDAAARGHLRVDPAAACVVRRVFSEVADGESCATVAAGLEADGVLTPAAYARAAGTRGKGACYATQGFLTPWNARKVRYIVRREVYAGVLVAGVTRGRAVGRGAPRCLTDAASRVRVEDAHEAIVSRELFDIVQARMGWQRRPKVGQ